MALAGNEDPSVLLTTTTIPMKTMKAFFLCNTIDQDGLGTRSIVDGHTDEKLYGFSGSSCSHDMTFLSDAVTLDELEAGDLSSKLSAFSRLYLSATSFSSAPEMPEITRESRLGPEEETQ